MLRWMQAAAWVLTMGVASASMVKHRKSQQ
jgi:hypothetical protein